MRKQLYVTTDNNIPPICLETAKSSWTNRNSEAAKIILDEQAEIEKEKERVAQMAAHMGETVQDNKTLRRVAECLKSQL